MNDPWMYFYFSLFTLHKGGFGVVYKATMQGSKTVDVAVKELRSANDPNSIYEFQHEVNIMR